MGLIAILEDDVLFVLGFAVLLVILIGVGIAGVIRRRKRP
jgi:hypothetical protein